MYLLVGLILGFLYMYYFIYYGYLVVAGFRVLGREGSNFTFKKKKIKREKKEKYILLRR